MVNAEERAVIEQQIAELQSRLADDPVGYRMPCRVTVCMPAGPYALIWLWRSILALEPGHQSIPLALHVTASQDAPPEAAALQAGLAVWGKRRVRIGTDEFPSFQRYQFVGVVPDRKNRLANICAARKKLADSVETEYTMWVDADVLTPPGGIARLVEEMDANPKLAWLGIPYAFEVDHPQNGCTLARTELMQKLSWAPNRCSCAQACKELKEMGYEVANVEDMVARHIKLER